MSKRRKSVRPSLKKDSSPLQPQPVKKGSKNKKKKQSKQVITGLLGDPVTMFDDPQLKLHLYPLEQQPGSSVGSEQELPANNNRAKTATNLDILRLDKVKSYQVAGKEEQKDGEAERRKSLFSKAKRRLLLPYN